MKTYLSIDLDFWNQGKSSFPHLFKFLKKAQESVSPSNLEIVDSHEELLPFVNASGCNELINVDWHSDISNRFDPKRNLKSWKELNCGTWVTFVDFRQEGVFTWIHPYQITPRSKRGYCHYPYKEKHNPFIHPELGGWPITIEKTNKHPEKIIDWSEITHVGICYSYEWVGFNAIWEIAESVLGFKPKKNLKALL